MEKQVRSKYFILVLLLLMLHSFPLPKAEAVPAYPGVVQLNQPNGQALNANFNGDEWQNWTSTSSDNSVIVQDHDGYWKYARISFGQLQPTEAKVGIDPVPPDVVSGTEWKMQLTEMSEGARIPKFYYDSGSGPSSAVPLQATGGPQNVLVLLVSFTDRTIQYSENAWNNAFFGDSGDTVKNFFKENSYNNFYFTPAAESFGTANNGVVKVTLNYAHPNTGAATGDANRLIVKNALIAADANVNYASFDTNGNGYIENNELHIVTIVAGYERSCGAVAPNVWGHRWSFWGTVAAPQLDGKFLGASGYGGYTQQGETHAISGDHMATIGILSHELAHDLGTPDLYNTDTGAAVVGASSLMDSGSWGAGPGDYPGGSPAHLDPWDKQFLGFATATVVNSGIHNMNVASLGSYNMLRYNTTNPDEYFLIENRNRTGFDDGLFYDGITNGGIAIWHIEEGIIGTYKASNKVNGNGHNPGIWLEKAVSSGEPYFRLGGAKDSFGDTTTPNSKLYSGVSSSLTATVLDTSANTMRVQIGAGAAVQFSPTTYSVAEDGGSVELTVTRTGDTTGPLTVDFTTANGTASAGSDFSSTSGTIAFADGESSKTINVSISEDTAVEANETFSVTLSNASSGSISSATATVTITDNDCTVSINPTTYTVAENGGTVTLTVTRTGTTSTAVTVDYTTANGTAQAGNDYTTTSGTLSFAAAQTSKTIVVPILEDTAYETAETFTLTLNNPTNGAAVGSGTGTVTISANDSPVIAFNPVNYTIAEDGGTVDLTVTRTGDSLTAVSVNYATSNGTALAGSDYTTASGTINLGIGETSKTITLTILDNLVNESSETFTVTLSGPGGGAVLGTSSAAVTITDDDPVGAQLDFNPSSYTVAENGGSVTLTVTRTVNTTGPLTVDYATANGTATAGSDYTGASGTISFADGESSKPITLNIAEDTAVEANETFTVALSNASSGAIGSATATVSITDNDCTVSFNPTSYTQAENGGSVTLTVTRTGATSTVVTVDYTTADGTAQAGTDYTTTSGTLSFTAGQTSKNITVPILDDTAMEGNENLTLTLSNPTNSASVGSGTATVTISANDSPVIAFNPVSYTIAEAGGTVDLTVTRTGDSSLLVSVNYATANNTAQAGSDYTTASGTLNFGIGETSKTITVAILDDGSSEGSESFSALLSSPGGGATLGTSTAAVIITDNDGAAGTVVSITFGGGATFAAVGMGQSKTVILNGVLDNGGVQDITALATWVSSNPEVATVDGGNITGVGAGTTVVTATYNGLTCKLTVVVR